MRRRFWTTAPEPSHAIGAADLLEAADELTRQVLDVSDRLEDLALRLRQRIEEVRA